MAQVVPQKLTKNQQIRLTVPYQLLDGVIKDWLLADPERIPKIRESKDSMYFVILSKIGITNLFWVGLLFSDPMIQDKDIWEMPPDGMESAEGVRKHSIQTKNGWRICSSFYIM